MAFEILIHSSIELNQFISIQLRFSNFNFLWCSDWKSKPVSIDYYGRKERKKKFLKFFKRIFIKKTILRPLK